MVISPTSGTAQAVFVPSMPAANQQARPAVPVSVAGLAAPQAAPVDDAVLQRALITVNAQMEKIPSSIQFSRDEDSGRPLIKVVDKQTNTVILQIPSVEVLEIARALDKLQGLLIRIKA